MARRRPWLNKGEQYQAAGVREILETRMKRGRKGNGGLPAGE